MSGRSAWVLAVVVVLVAAAVRIAHVQVARLEVDELQHLHAAYLVARGQTPYADFFEHHSPAFYLLGGALMDPGSASFDTILRFRFGSLALHAVAMATAVALAAGAGSAVGAAALALLLVEIFSFAWGTLSFLDSYAVVLVLFGALLLSRGARGPGVALAGLLTAFAVLFTQKAAFAALAAVVVTMADVPGGATGVVPRLRRLGWLAAGALLAVGLLAWRLGSPGMVGLWQDTVVLNSSWKARRWPLGEAFLVASYGPALWWLAAAGSVVAAHDTLLRRRALPRPVWVPVVYLASLLSGALVLPVVWYEYFVEIGPFTAIVAAVVAVDLARVAGLLPGAPMLVRTQGGARVVLWGVVLASLVGLILRTVVGHYSPTLGAFGLAGTLAVVGGLALAARGAWRAGRRPACALALLAAVCAPMLAAQLTWFGRGGLDRQREGIAFVLAHAGPDDAVLDGYSGFGVFRPHAYRYWFLHDEMLLMLPPAQLRDEVIAAVEDPRVRLVVRDEYLEALDPVVQRRLDALFVPAWRDLVWVRREPRT